MESILDVQLTSVSGLLEKLKGKLNISVMADEDSQFDATGV